MKKRKVKIVAMPKAANGANISMGNSTFFNPNYMNVYTNVDNFSAPATVAKRTISGDPNPNIEAEGGETIVDDRDKDGIAEHYNISGPRHTNGGVDINAGENAFVFSDTKAMKIGGDILKAFGKSGKKKLTPADIAKQYDINSFLAILKDPDADDLQIETAKTVINNCNNKLGALALVQESKKGFEAGIPAISYQYLQSIGVDPMSITPDFGPDEPEGNMARYGGSFNLPIAQNGNQGNYAEEFKKKEEAIAKQKALDAIAAQKKLEKKILSYPTDLMYERNKVLKKMEKAKQDLAFLEAQRKDLFSEPPVSSEDFILGDFANWVTNPFTKVPLTNQLAEGLNQHSMNQIVSNKKSIEERQKILKALQYELESVDPASIQRNAKEQYNPTYKTQAEYEAHLADPYSEEKKFAQRAWVAKNEGKTSPVKHYASQAEYEADLLSPYSRAKRLAQLEWLNKQKEAAATMLPNTGVTADSVNVPMTDTTIYMNDPATQALLKTFKTDAERAAWYDAVEKRHGAYRKENGVEHGTIVKQYGGDLPKAQKGKFMTGSKKVAPKSSTTYNVYNEEAMKEADRLGYHYVHPSESYRWNQENVGSQRPSQSKDWAYDPEAGFIMPTTTGKTYGAGALNDFTNRWGDIIDKYPGGREAWIKDLKEGYVKGDAKGTNNQNKAMRYLLPLANEEHKKITGHELQSLTQEDAYVPGSKLFSLPRLAKNEAKKIEEAPAAIPSKETPQVEYKPGINHIAPERKREIPNEYWLQDAIRQRGNARDYLTLKKYMPWQATPDVHLAEGVFEDPNRGIAAMQENINAQNQMMGTFAGPQGLARSQASAKGVGAMADYISGVANRNIDRANQMELYNTDVLNKGAMTRAGLATDLYDKNTIANQQFDNSKRQILHNMDDTQIAAETNRAYTYNMNQINPHYNINPSLGGDMYFTGNTDPLSLAYEDPDAWLNQYAHYRKIMPASVTDDALIKLLSENKRKASANPYADIVNSGMYPGMT